MTRQTDTDWVREGAPVAELTTGNPDTVKYATIAKLTATQITLDNGRKYNRAKLRPVGEKISGYTGWTYLKPTTDERVRQAASAQVVRRLGLDVQRMCGQRPGSPDEALALVDQIAELVAAAREAITGKEA